MPRLYLRFYLALLGSLVVFAVIMALFWHRTEGPAEKASAELAQLIQNVLPPADAPAAQQQQALQRVATGLVGDLSLIAADHSLIAAVGRPLHLPPDHAHPGNAEAASRNDAVWSLHLPDGRVLVASSAIGFDHSVHALLLTLSLLAAAVGIGAYPLARRLTQRLERLQRGVESLGAGDLSARVAVEGRDEVAQLAASFNRAAGRIEQLVSAHKSLLANASHELRTPLARIRMAIELMKGAADPKRRAGLEADIAELDQLIDEILLASRLGAISEPEVREQIDLLALAAEECARYDDAHLDGTAMCIDGDPRLLRRLLRNLLENAVRHGRSPTQVQIVSVEGSAEIRVHDSGPGIPTDQVERLFEPFHRLPGNRDNAGNGLGLALVRQIARHHGGDVRYVRADDGGGCFVVTLRAYT